MKLSHIIVFINSIGILLLTLGGHKDYETFILWSSSIIGITLGIAFGVVFLAKKYDEDFKQRLELELQMRVSQEFMSRGKATNITLGANIWVAFNGVCSIILFTSGYYFAGLCYFSMCLGMAFILSMFSKVAKGGTL